MPHLKKYDLTRTEFLILLNLVKNEPFFDKVIDHLKANDIKPKLGKQLLPMLIEYKDENRHKPDINTLLSIVENNPKLRDPDKKLIYEFIEFVKDEPITQNYEPLFKCTEEYVRDYAFEVALCDCYDIFTRDDKKDQRKLLPAKMEVALNKSFNTNLGYKLFDNLEERYNAYTSTERKIPFSIDKLNEVTNGGVPRGTLNLLCASTNVGKTMLLCALTSMYIKLGYNVLYISVEASELEIWQRIDSNLFNIDMDTFSTGELKHNEYFNKSSSVKDSITGDLRVAAFPPKSASVSTFNTLMRELEVKQKYKPDIVMVDYLGEVESCRVKMDGSNSNTYLSSVAIELRAFFIIHNVVGWSAMQFNRDGTKTNKGGLTDLAGSFDVAHKADMSWSLLRTEELDKQGKIMVMHEKSRYIDKSKHRSFVIGIDPDHFSIHDSNHSVTKAVDNGGL